MGQFQNLKKQCSTPRHDLQRASTKPSWWQSGPESFEIILESWNWSIWNDTTARLGFESNQSPIGPWRKHDTNLETLTRCHMYISDVHQCFILQIPGGHRQDFVLPSLKCCPKPRSSKSDDWKCPKRLIKRQTLPETVEVTKMNHFYCPGPCSPLYTPLPGWVIFWFANQQAALAIPQTERTHSGHGEFRVYLW